MRGQIITFYIKSKITSKYSDLCYRHEINQTINGCFDFKRIYFIYLLFIIIVKY